MDGCGVGARRGRRVPGQGQEAEEGSARRPPECRLLSSPAPALEKSEQGALGQALDQSAGAVQATPALSIFDA